MDDLYRPDTDAGVLVFMILPRISRRDGVFNWAYTQPIRHEAIQFLTSKTCGQNESDDSVRTRPSSLVARISFSSCSHHLVSVSHWRISDGERYNGDFAPPSFFIPDYATVLVGDVGKNGRESGYRPERAGEPQHLGRRAEDRHE
jgi:hypothetical protein